MFDKLTILGLLLRLSFGVAVELEEDLLSERMCGSRGGNRITVCMCGHLPHQYHAHGDSEGGLPRSATASCSGALVHTRLVLVRASCLHDQPPHTVHMFPTRENLSCDHVNVLSSDKVRRVVNQYIHPSYHALPSQNDFALISISRPYTMDTIEYTNNTYLIFNPWVYHIMNLHQPFYTREQRRTSPEKLFLMAVILPFILFILFFMYVTSATTQHNHTKGKTIY